MRYIKSFKVFESYSNNDDTLFVFDFDTTLVDSPRFEDIAIEYLGESVIATFIDKSMSYIKKSIDDIKVEHGRLYIDDPNSQIEVRGNWVRKKGRVYLVSPNDFYFHDISFPTKSLQLASLYNSVKNKAIITGRFKKVQSKVEDCLDKLGLHQPNKGLFCYPSKDESGDRLAQWKAKTIVELIKDTGFKKAKFYDDKSKIVNAVVLAVKTHLPEIEFEGIKVKP